MQEEGLWEPEAGDRQEATAEIDEPCYVISVAARMLSVHAQTLRYYERAGLVRPSRSGGKIRLYSPRDIQRLRRIKTLMDALGVNLAGVEVVLRMSERMEQMQQLVRRLLQEMERLRGTGVQEAVMQEEEEAPGQDAPGP